MSAVCGRNKHNFIKHFYLIDSSTYHWLACQPLWQEILSVLARSSLFAPAPSVFNCGAHFLFKRCSSPVQSLSTWYSVAISSYSWCLMGKTSQMPVPQLLSVLKFSLQKQSWNVCFRIWPWFVLAACANHVKSFAPDHRLIILQDLSIAALSYHLMFIIFQRQPKWKLKFLFFLMSSIHCPHFQH